RLEGRASRHSTLLHGEYRDSVPRSYTPDSLRGLCHANLFGAGRSRARVPAVFSLASADPRAPACPGVFRKGKLFLFLRYPVACGDHRVATASPRRAPLRRGCQPSKHSDLFPRLARAAARKRSPSGSRLIWPADRPSLSVFEPALARLLALLFFLLRLC